MIKGKDGLGEMAADNGSGIMRYRYIYCNSFRSGSFNFEVVRNDSDSAVIKYLSADHDEYGTMELKTSGEILDALYQMYLKHKAARWNGYHKYNEGVLDGSGFSFDIEFNDGENMSCSGDNCSPEGYGAYKKELLEIIEPYLQQMRDKGRDEMIGKGISGELNMAMVNFISNTFGKDRFEMMIRQYNENRKNFDVRIASYTGEFIEKGKYNYYYMLPDEDIGFENIKALIEKYGIIRWYDWDKTARDPNNAEWFQICFSFETGSIQAMGTEHPDNYDEFRRELLKYIVEVIRKAEAKYDDFRSR